MCISCSIDHELTTRDARRGHVRVPLRSIKRGTPIIEQIDDPILLVSWGHITNTRLTMTALDLIQFDQKEPQVLVECSRYASTRFPAVFISLARSL